MELSDPRTMHNQRLNWPEPPKNVLVIHKIHDSSILPSFIQLTQWLLVVSFSQYYSSSKLPCDVFFFDSVEEEKQNN